MAVEDLLRMCVECTGIYVVCLTMLCNKKAVKQAEVKPIGQDRPSGQKWDIQLVNGRCFAHVSATHLVA